MASLISGDGEERVYQAFASRVGGPQISPASAAL